MARKKTEECVPTQPKYPREPYPSTAKPSSVLGLPSFPMPDADGDGDCHCTFGYESHTNGRKRGGE